MPGETMQRCCKTLHSGSHAEFKIRRAAQMREWVKKNPAKVAAYRQKGKEQRREYFRRYRTANAEQLRHYSEAYRREHVDRMQELRRTHYLRNKDRSHAQAKAWLKSHPEAERRKARRQCERLTNGYVARLLKKNMTTKGVQIPRVLIETKRTQLMIYRLTRSTT